MGKHTGISDVGEVVVCASVLDGVSTRGDNHTNIIARKTYIERNGLVNLISQIDSR